MGILTSIFEAWSIGGLWDLNETNCYSNKTPSYGIMLDMTGGVHEYFQKGTMVLGWSCQISINPTLVPKTIQCTPPLGVQVLWLMWTN
jgi:hypothetical protein